MLDRISNLKYEINVLLLIVSHVAQERQSQGAYIYIYIYIYIHIYIYKEGEDEKGKLVNILNIYIHHIVS